MHSAMARARSLPTASRTTESRRRRASNALPADASRARSASSGMGSEDGMVKPTRACIMGRTSKLMEHLLSSGSTSPCSKTSGSGGAVQASSARTTENIVKYGVRRSLAWSSRSSFSVSAAGSGSMRSSMSRSCSTSASASLRARFENSHADHDWSVAS